jgi:DNA-binding beta-propeller fold protein YncE
MSWRQILGAGLLLGLVVSGTVTAPATAQPSSTAPRQVFVVNTGDASVALVDLASMKPVNTWKVGPRPYGIAVSRDGKTVAVGVEDEEKVKFFSLPDFKLKGEVKIGKMFNDHIVLTKDGKHILVANFYSDDVVGIDMATMKEEFRIRDCSAPHVVRYGPLGKHIFVTCKKITGVAIIDPDKRELVKFHQLTVNPRSLTFSPDESKVYFGSFWVNGFFEADLKTGKVTRLFSADPPKDNAQNQEVTYHGVQAVHGKIILAANEGRSYVDAFNMGSGKHLSRFADVSKPCCIEPIPGTEDQVLFSNIGDGTLQRVHVSAQGEMRSLGRAQVGKAPKRVAFLPNSASR